MKRSLTTFAFAFCFVLGSQAQYEKTDGSNYNSDEANTVVATLNAIGLFGQGDPSFGLSLRYDNLANIVGLEYSIHSTWKSGCPQNMDVGLNLSYPIYNQGDWKVYPTAYIGPSLYIPFDEKKSGKFAFNGYMGARVTGVYKRFALGLGWYCFNPKWKFKGMGNAFYLSLGCTL